jgi:PKD repeat protein
MFKIIDSSIPAAAPQVSIHISEQVTVGQPALFSAETEANSVAAINYHWDFGDGTSSDAPALQHTFTHGGNFTIHLLADGIEGVPFEKIQEVSVSGALDSTFNPEHIVPRKQ